MRRFLIALAVAVTATVSPAWAGYIIIRVLLEDETGGAAAPGGKTGMPGPGAGGLMKPGRGSGSGKMAGPPSPGGLSGPTFPGAGKAAPATAPGEIDHTRSVVVVIPLEADLKSERLDKKHQFHPQNNPDYRKFVAPYNGKVLHASLFVDSTSIQLYDQLIAQPAPKKTRHTQLLDKYALWRSKKDPQALYDALLLALESGYIREPRPADGGPAADAVTFAQELLEVAAESKNLPPAVDRFVKAWGAMAKAVRAPATQSGDAANWQSKLEAKDVRVEGHYALVYFDSPAAEVERRTKQLNDHFHAFFLAHATRGITVPVPTKPLVAVLLPDGKLISKYNRTLDGLPVHNDAFYAPDHEVLSDVLVLSPERLDAVGQTFLQQTHQVFATGLSRDPLLAGVIPKLDASGDKGLRPDDVARASTLAVVEKLVVQEAEIASVSREGTRQLMFATGQLPKFVVLPNWLTNGAVDYYARPRGPAYVTNDDDKAFMHVALTTGYGLPNYTLLRYFRDLDTHKELGKDPARLLEHVLTDAYFAGIKNADDPDPAPPAKKKSPEEAPAPKTSAGLPGMPGGMKPQRPGGGDPGGPPLGKFPLGPGGGSGSGMPGMPKGPGMPGMPGMRGPRSEGSDGEDPAVTQRKKRDRLAIKSQATAWALYFYLAREKPDQLQQFIGELNKMPRDLPIDGRTAYNTFVRVFGLSSSGGDGADVQKMKQFATEWVESVRALPLVGFDIELVVPEAKESTTPGFPKSPGGGPFMPKGPGGGGSGQP